MDFVGKTIIVTGASDGIGKAASRQWAADGAHVVMVGRNEAKTAAAARAILSAHPGSLVTWHIADLSRRDSLMELVDVLHRAYPSVHVLANNAGALFLDREETRDGLEHTFALNHLAYVTVALALLPALQNAASDGHPSRIINVSSRAHVRASLRKASRPTNAIGSGKEAGYDWQLTQGFTGWRAYSNSKLYNIWFTRWLAARLSPRHVVAHSMHPGVVRTRFATNNGPMGRLQRRVMNLVSVTAEQGADTMVWLSHSDDAARTTGRYWIKRQERQPTRLARRDDLAETLMAYTLPLTGLDAATLATWHTSVPNSVPANGPTAAQDASTGG